MMFLPIKKIIMQRLNERWGGGGGQKLQERFYELLTGKYQETSRSRTNFLFCRIFKTQLINSSIFLPNILYGHVHLVIAVI